MKKKMIFILSVVFGFVAGVSGMKKISLCAIQKKTEESNKYLKLFIFMCNWMERKQKGKNVSIYFTEHGYKRIAVYGMSYAGNILVNELKNSEVEVSYGIDQNAEGISTDIDIILPDGAFDKVDAIVVTAITNFEEVKAMLSDKIECPIISLEEVVYGE